MHDYDDVPNILSVFGDSVCEFPDFVIESNLPAISNEDVATLLGSSTSDQSATNDELSILKSPHTVSNILQISFDEQQNLQQNFEYSNEESEKVKSDVLSKRVEKEQEQEQEQQEQEQEVIPKKNQKALSRNSLNKLNDLNISDNMNNTNNKKTGLNEKRNATQQNSRKRRKKIKVISVKKKIICNNKETTITQRFPLNGSKDPQEMTKEIEQKMKLKKQRNRINARKCRQRKKQYIENLESKTKFLQLENSKLSGQVLKLNQKTVNLQLEIENLKLALKRSNEKIILQNQTKLNKENDNEKEPKNGKAKRKKIVEFITNLTTIPSFNSDLVIKNETQKEDQEVHYQQYQYQHQSQQQQQQQQQQQHTHMMGEQLFNSTNLNKKYKATFFVILLTFGLFFTNPNFIEALAEICVGSWKKTFSPRFQSEAFFSLFLNLFSKKAAYELEEEQAQLKHQLSFQIRDQLKVNQDHKHNHRYLADDEKTKFNNHLLSFNLNTNTKTNKNTKTKTKTNMNMNMNIDSFYCDDQSIKSKISESIFSLSMKNKHFSS